MICKFCGEKLTLVPDAAHLGAYYKALKPERPRNKYCRAAECMTPGGFITLHEPIQEASE